MTQAIAVTRELEWFGLEADRDVFEQGLDYPGVLRLLKSVQQEFAIEVDLEEFLVDPTPRHLRGLLAVQPRRAAAVVEPSVSGASALFSSQARETQTQLEQAQSEQCGLSALLREAELSIELDTETDLFEQGLTSLMLLRLLTKAKHQWGIDVDLEAFMLRPTLRHLLDLVALRPDPLPRVAAGVAQPEPAVPQGATWSEAAKAQFLAAGHNLRKLGQTPATGARAPAREQFEARYERRKSQRHFVDEPLDEQALVAWLAELSCVETEGKRHYLYPSAGSTYAVQVYVEVHADRVRGLDAGSYYFDPIQARLQLVSREAVPSKAHFPYNQRVCERAACRVYLVSEGQGIEPLYGGLASPFVYAEAGAMIQLLRERQAQLAIGSTVLAGLSTEAVRQSLRLEPSQQLLFTIAAGKWPAGAPAHEPATTPASADDPVVIVGLNARLPGARNLQEFWQNLRSGTVSMSRIEAEQSAGEARSESYAGRLDDIGELDLQALGLSEAQGLDAQEQLALESVCLLLEESGQAGACLQRLGRDVAVFVGVMWNDTRSIAEGEALQGAPATHAPLSSIANRISHYFDWIGPSIAVDTSCSSSLSSISLACDAIRQGRCRSAVVVGVNVIGHVSHLDNLRRLGLIASGPRSDTFGCEAQGWLAGEGVGSLLLKTRSAAEAEGDLILGVIRGESLMSGGRAPRYGSPAPEQQAELIRRVLTRAGLDADGIDYVETAAAGSAMGDASEVHALTRAFGARTRKLPIGSVKPNIGHLESASGISQLAKVLLQFDKQEIVGTIAVAEHNPLLRLDSGPLEIVTTPRPWLREGNRPRRALINGFGGTGSYASLIIEEPEPRITVSNGASGAPEAILLSAETKQKLRELATHMRHRLDETRTLASFNLSDLACSLRFGRDARPERLSVQASSFADLASKLDGFLRGELQPGSLVGSVERRDPRVPLSLWGLPAEDLARAWVTQPGIWPGAASGMPRFNKVPLPPRSLRSQAAGVERPIAQTAADGGAGPNAALEAFLAQRLRHELGDAAPRLLTDLHFGQVGLTSMAMVRIVADLERTLDLQLPPDILLRQRCLKDLTQHLAQLGARAPACDAASVRVPAQACEPSSLLAPAVVAGVPAPHSPVLTDGQKGLWALQRLQPESVAYNCPLAFRVRGGLTLRIVQEACQLLLQRYPVLTATFLEQDGAVTFALHPNAEVPVHELTVRGEAEAAAMERLRGCARLPFDLRRETPVRAHFMRLDEGNALVMLTIHHIVFDGGSYAPLVRHFFSCCSRLAGGERVLCEPAPHSFFEFAMRQAQQLASDDGARRLSYWRSILATLPAPVVLPSEAVQQSVTRAAFTEAYLSTDARERLTRLAQTGGFYPSTILLAAFAAVLCRYGRQDSVLIAVPQDLRARAEERNEVGFFVNVLPVVAHAPAELNFSQVLEELQRTLLTALAHSCPWPRLVRELGLAARNGDSALLRVGFTYQSSLGDTVTGPFAAGSFQVSPIDAIAQEGELDLSLEVFERSQGTLLRLHCSKQIERAVSEHVLGHVLKLLEESLAAPHRPLARQSILTAAEVRTLASWNDTAFEHQPRRLEVLIGEQCSRYPQATSHVFEGRTLSYGELWRRSGELAKELRRRGVGPDVLVGVCMSRSLELPVALLGVLRAGGAYVPIDPDNPSKRIAFIVAEIAGPVVLSQSRHASSLSGISTETLVLDESSWNFGSPDEPLAVHDSLDDLAYVIYTSGSTGQPKGCLLTHAAIVNRLLWMQRAYGLSQNDRVLQKTPYAFDVSVWEFFWPLLVGATLVLATPGRHSDPRYLKQLIEEQGVGVCHFVPSMLRAFVGELKAGECSSLRKVFSSGEALPHDLVEAFQGKSAAELHNLYGPTEAAVDVTFYAAKSRGDRRVPIGRPIDNCQVHILGSHGEQLPVGIAGELHIGGICLARGYLNRPELTAEKFVESPLLLGGSARLYRSGDLARWLPEGNVEYLGRIDQQVKIRGFRIELGEVEHALSQLQAVRECAVAAVSGATGGVELTAYLVFEQDVSVLPSELRRRLADSLPEHMVPTRFVPLPELPVTASGKLDRKRLSLFGQARESRTDLARPRDATEERLLPIWQAVLDIEHLGVEDDFFDLGGHSLKLVTLIARIEQSFPGSRIDQIDFVKQPTLRGVASLLARPPTSARELLPCLWAPPGEPELTLLCCPYAGAQPLVFQPLAQELQHLGARIAVHAVATEAATTESLRSLSALAEACAERAMTTLHGPIAVYGHCVGSFLALEIVRCLEARGRTVKVLFAAAAFPFHRTVRFAPFEDPWRPFGDRRVHALMKYWGARQDAVDDATLQTIVSRFRRDARLAFSYEKHRPDFRIAAPIVNVISANDKLTSGYRRRYRRWQAFSDSVRLILLDDGEHYFVASKARELATIVQSSHRNLLKLLSSADPVQRFVSEPGQH